jgi:hypothetical protein
MLAAATAPSRALPTPARRDYSVSLGRVLLERGDLLTRDLHALQARRGLRPVLGQTQELLSLLFGPSPGGPPEAISREFVIDRGHGTPLVSAGAQPVSQPPTPGRQNPGRWFQHHAPFGVRIAKTRRCFVPYNSPSFAHASQSVLPPILLCLPHS